MENSNQNLQKRTYEDRRREGKPYEQSNKPENFGKSQSKVGVGHVLPMEVLDKCVGKRLKVLMKNK